MKKSLIEKQSNIQHSKVGTSLDVGNDLQLERQGVEVRENHLVEFSYDYYCSTLSFAVSIKRSDNKHWETE